MPAGLGLDQMSVYDWIESRVPGGHDAPLGALLDASYAIECATDTRPRRSRPAEGPPAGALPVAPTA
jgi:monoamine oxidase